MSTAHTFPVMRPLYAESFEERVASRPSVQIRARFVEPRIIINARDGRRIHLSNIERRAEEQVTWGGGRDGYWIECSLHAQRIQIHFMLLFIIDHGRARRRSRSCRWESISLSKDVTMRYCNSWYSICTSYTNKSRSSKFKLHIIKQ